jgi:Protein of unknown function (DUF3747)
MKPSSIVYTTALLWSVGFAASHVLPATAAAAFDQKELEPSRVIAVAVPLAQGDRYNLLILEQLSDAKQCWQQNPGNASLIDPLLLQFDFTGICGRSTDSNGYSVRIAGQDRALDYRLSIAKERDHLVLWAVPSRNAQSPALAIARTDTLTSGFLRLQLNSDWRFTKRTYGGKTLGHIYLTRDTEGNTGNIATATPLLAAATASTPSHQPSKFQSPHPVPLDARAEQQQRLPACFPLRLPPTTIVCPLSPPESYLCRSPAFPWEMQATNPISSPLPIPT